MDSSYYDGVTKSVFFAAAAFVLMLFGCAGTPGETGAAADYYNIGNAYVELGQYDRAVDNFQKALRLDPRLAKADFNLALTYARMKRTAEAETILRRLLQTDPQNTRLLAALGWAYHADGREEDALGQYDAIIAISPADTDALYNSGIILWKLGRKAEAIDRLRTELSKSPDDTDALFAAGQLLLDLDDPAGSFDMLSRYLEKKPDDKDALFSVADGAERMQKYSRALDAYDKIIAADVGQAKAWFGEARLLLTVVQDSERGLKALDRALGAGFKDAAAIKVLLETPTLLERDKVEAALKARSLLPAAADATVPAAGPSAGK